MEIPDVQLLSVGTVLPGSPVGNAALARRFKMNRAGEDWIDTFVGTRNRHFAFDLETGERFNTLVDLGAEAGRRALERAALKADDIDLIVMGTWSSDYLMPASVNMVADKLGINNVTSYQIQSGCSGAIQALDIAHQMLRGGRHKNALVIGADTCAKHYHTDFDPLVADPTNLINFMLFGDGAGAAVLGTSSVPGAPIIRRVMVKLTGLGQSPGQVVEWFGMADRGTERAPVSENYKAIEARVPTMTEETFHQLLDDLEWDVEETDYLLPPQLSGKMTERIIAQLNVSHIRPISCVAEIGNTGNSLPFFQLERLLPLLMEGDRAICVAIESSKWIKSGFALEMAA